MADASLGWLEIEASCLLPRILSQAEGPIWLINLCLSLTHALKDHRNVVNQAPKPNSRGLIIANMIKPLALKSINLPYPYPKEGECFEERAKRCSLCISSS